MPAYKLLITSTVKSTTFGDLLHSHEVVRGDPFLLTLEIENIGETEFPGGKIEQLKIGYGAPVHASDSISVVNECPPLAKGQSIKLMDDPVIIPFDEGLGWIQVTLTPIGEPQAVEYYQQRDQPPIVGNMWVSPIYVVSREYLKIIELLTKLLEKSGPVTS